MEKLLNALADLEQTASPRRDEISLHLLGELIEQLRPHGRGELIAAVNALRALTLLLEREAKWRHGMRRALLGLLGTRSALSLLTLAGILPSTGFFTEVSRRIGHSVLPEVIDITHLRDVLRVLFPHARDAFWVQGIPDEEWCAFLRALFADTESATELDAVLSLRADAKEALRIVSYRLAASGLEPELVRLEPSLAEYESPFVAQNVELLTYLEARLAGQRPEPHHLLVLIGQCHDWLARIRKQAVRMGTSIALTFLIRRLRQMLKRMERLLANLEALDAPPATRNWQPAVAMFKRLVKAECLRNNLRVFLQQQVSLLALRVTENAGRAGEHYITNNRNEYFALLRSALLAGAIIAAMALSKIGLARLELAPLNEALAFCLNYGLGFVLIHLLHGTVATKQPAMTANAIAASLSDGKDLVRLLDLVARTVRSQLAAILGNIGLAVPTAILLALAVAGLSGGAGIDAEKAGHLLHDTHPLTSPALFYAAVAGVCLFVSGLVAGYFDNYAAYERIPERIAQLGWARRLFGEARMRRVADYIGNNLGALAGNFFFGFLLGGAWAFGVLFGLPIDIRHVAFSSANLGFALVGSGFTPDWGLYAWAALGVLLVGLVNLLVSFSLAIIVALRSRRIAVVGGWRLIGAVLRHLLRNPRSFLLPPKRNAAINGLD